MRASRRAPLVLLCMRLSHLHMLGAGTCTGMLAAAAKRCPTPLMHGCALPRFPHSNGACVLGYTATREACERRKSPRQRMPPPPAEPHD